MMHPGHVRLCEASKPELMNTDIISHTIVPYFCSPHQHLMTWNSPTVVPVSEYYWRELQFLLVFASKPIGVFTETPILFALDANRFCP